VAVAVTMRAEGGTDFLTSVSSATTQRRLCHRTVALLLWCIPDLPRNLLETSIPNPKSFHWVRLSNKIGVSILVVPGQCSGRMIPDPLAMGRSVD
jgi:hypothetical protein